MGDTPCQAAHYQSYVKDFIYDLAPNVVIRWLKILLRMWEVLALSLAPETGSPE
jgi:hypothetical protein